MKKPLLVLQPDPFSTAFARAFPDEPEYVDEFVIDLDTGIIDGWACAVNDVLAATGAREKVKLGRCPAPTGDCPRGMTRSFQCKEKT